MKVALYELTNHITPLGYAALQSMAGGNFYQIFRAELLFIDIEKHFSPLSVNAGINHHIPLKSVIQK